MRVFLSWSGKRSKLVAEILKIWIKGVIQATEPYISTKDLDKGAVWSTAVGDTLASTNFGIICLTNENKNAPWILFEAGALSKGLSQSRVWTFLIDLDHPDLAPPLSQFNGTTPIKEDMEKLVASINTNLGEKALPPEVLKEAFENAWGRFKSKFEEALKSTETDSPNVAPRPPIEIAQETLITVRAIHSFLQEQHRKEKAERYRRILDSIRAKTADEVIAGALLGLPNKLAQNNAVTGSIQKLADAFEGPSLPGGEHQ